LTNGNRCAELAELSDVLLKNNGSRRDSQFVVIELTFRSLNAAETAAATEEETLDHASRTLPDPDLLRDLAKGRIHFETG